jgi:hypothetical protein
MKFSIIELGSSPSDEACAQVGHADYLERSRTECKVFRSQILRHYPRPEGLEQQAGLGIASHPHELGNYRTVDVAYDPFSVRATQWASLVDSDPLGMLTRWDEVAREELGLREAVVA